MKFSGKIGFWEKDVEVRPGVYRPDIVEKPYTGDILVNTLRYRSSSLEPSQNQQLTINNRFSILADIYMQDRTHSIKYVIWKGKKWSVTSITPYYPRIEIEIGDEYHVSNATGSPESIGEYSWR